MAWPTVPSWTAGEVVTSTDLNLIRDALNTIGGAWSTYTPVLSSSGTTPTIGNSSAAGRYQIKGHTGNCHINFTIGSTFNAGTGTYQISLPSGFTPLLTGLSEVMGVATVRDTSVPSTTLFAVYYFSPTKVALVSPGNPGVGLSATTITWAAGDVISLHLTDIELA